MCTHTQLCVRMVEPCTCILDDACASFSTKTKNHIFIDLIKQRYSMWDQINKLETLNTKLTKKIKRTSI